MDCGKLDVRLIPGGIWPGAEVQATHTNGTAITGVAEKDPEGWRICHHMVDLIVVDRAPWDWTLSLRLPGPRGLGLEGLLRGVVERAGLDEWGVLKKPPSGATWKAAAEIAEACRTGDEHRIVWASMRLVMTDALAAKQDYPTGPGAPVWAWTKARLPDRHGVQQWKLSARASSKESWSSWFSCDLEDPDAALEATWRKECV